MLTPGFRNDFGENDDQKGKIIDIIEGGYKLGDQVVKFPKVVVAQ